MAKNGRMLGQAASGDVSPVWGVVASGVTGTGTAMALRSMTGMDKNAELIGMGAGVAAGVALMLGKKTRAAGFTGVVTALLANGLRYVEALTSKKQQIKDLQGAQVTFLEKRAATKIPVAQQLELAKAAAAAAGFGIVTTERRTLAGGLGAISAQRVQAFGAMSAQQVPLFGGGGLGIVSPEVVRSLGGAGPVQFQGQRGPVTIQGAGGLGRHFGATLFGGAD